MGKNQHVVPNGSKWAVKGEGNIRSTKVFSNKQDAISCARAISANQHSELVIHNRDGRIAAKDSHGRDPSPPKG